MGARCGPCAWWEGPGLAAAEAGRSAGSVPVCGCRRREVWRRPGRRAPLPPPLQLGPGLTWWDADPGGPRTAPLHAALHLTGLICLLNMETTSSPSRPRAALRPVRLTLNVRPGGEICQADSHLHYSSWLFNRTGFTRTAAQLCCNILSLLTAVYPVSSPAISHEAKVVTRSPGGIIQEKNPHFSGLICCNR